jgi:hypothetical protein
MSERNRAETLKFLADHDLTYVAVDSDEHSAVKKYQWPYDREGNRLASVGAALDLLEKAIE